MCITGNLVNAYFICRRKFWLYGRQFNPDPDNDLLVYGKVINETFYQRLKKEIQFDHFKIDLIKKDNKNLIVCEVKKSQKGLEAAKMQLAYYLFRLKNLGIIAEGQILIPKEKKIIPFHLNNKIEQKLLEALKYMKEILNKDLPPPVVKTGFCKNCAFQDFCWA